MELTESTTQQIAIQRAEIDSQIATAKQYPRDLEKFKNDCIATISMSHDIAASCNYYLKRADKVIEGPSIRLAEIIMSNYGNLRVESKILGHDGKFITALAICHDLESNNAFRMEVRRRITGRNGKTFGDDMIQVTGAAASAIAVRNTLFKVIPGAFIALLSDEAKKLAIPPQEKFQETVEKWLKWFEDKGISSDRVLVKLGVKDVTELRNEHLTVLFGIHTAIKDGQTTVEQEFPNTLVEPEGLESDEPHPT